MGRRRPCTSKKARTNARRRLHRRPHHRAAGRAPRADRLPPPLLAGRPALGALPGVAPHPPPHARRQDQPLRFLLGRAGPRAGPFAPGAWCPLLEELDISCSRIEHARVDICLPFLRFMDLDGLDVNPDGRCQVPPFGEITIDAPELLELDVNCGAPGSTADYKSFTLRAPRLHFLFWCNQFAERVAIDVGRPGSVKVGAIVLMTVYTRELKDYQEQMMRMLEGLLPDVPPESIADVSKPFITLEECDDSDDDDEDDKVEKLTCDIKALLSRGM